MSGKTALVVLGMHRSGTSSVAGALALLGGRRHALGGTFFEPTVLTGVTPAMRLSREEIFGPVLSVITFDTAEEAVQIANDTPYGLCSYITSADKNRAYELAKHIDAGRVCINNVLHDPLAPFGGFKQSGVGREYGVFGLEAFLEPKAVIG